jgi:hypothetical protein
LVATAKTTCPSPFDSTGLVIVFGAEACASQIIHDLGTPFAGQVFRGKPGACTPLAPADAATMNFFMVGPATDLTKYQEASYGHD